MQIGFLGPKGSFSHNVSVAAFGKEELKSFASITEVVKAYEAHQVDYAIVPVENAIEGSVHETLDYLFHQAQIHAVAEVVQPIAQQLLATALEKPIQKIFSHPQAIAQGKKYIDFHYPKAQIELTTSTAYAARYIAEHPDEPFAAIAPVAAAETYGLTVIASDIQEIAQNYTRFWLLGASEPVLTLPLQGKERKLSLAVTLPNNQPGSLYQALSVFAWRKIDMTKLESRPLKTALGEYFFIMDIVYSHKESIEYALQELTSIGISYKILGDYLVYQMNQ